MAERSRPSAHAPASASVASSPAHAERLREFEASVGEHLLRPGADLLRTGVPIGPKQKILEVGCSTGYLTTALAESIDVSGGTQLMAVDPSDRMLDFARAKVALLGSGRKVFFKTDPLTQLRFASDVFDVCVSNLTLVESAGRDAILSETVRVLRPEGALGITALAQGSFEEALDLYQEVCVKYDLHAHLQTALSLIERVLDPSGLRKMLEAAGVRAVRLEERTVEVAFRNGREFVQDPMFSFGIFGLLRAAAGRSEQNQRIGRHLSEAIDAYFHGGDFRLSVHLVALFGAKVAPLEVGDDEIQEARPIEE